MRKFPRRSMLSGTEQATAARRRNTADSGRAYDMAIRSIERMHPVLFPRHKARYSLLHIFRTSRRVELEDAMRPRLALALVLAAGFGVMSASAQRGYDPTTDPVNIHLA